MARSEIKQELRRALVLIRAHPAVKACSAPKTNGMSDTITVDVTFNVELPSEWRHLGRSPSGIMLQEEVRIVFPNGFPLEPPEFSLRADFNRNLPHMQPWLSDGRPVPCIYRGDLAELLQREGLAAILNQMAIWLERAALGTLIDPDQGWEPVLRDSFADILVADAAFLQDLVDRRGGHRFVKMKYIKSTTDDGSPLLQGQIINDIAPVNRQTICGYFNTMEVTNERMVSYGQSLALVVWPGKHPSGKPVINDTYLPETVKNVKGLRVRAEGYACRQQLDAGLNQLRTCMPALRSSGPHTLAVILLVRRPFPIIGSKSPIELCPYVMEVWFPQLFANGEATAVRAAAQRNAISQDLLAQMAGLNSGDEALSWTLVGAGSLGSKIALHLARTGNGPNVVVDKSIMSPHNAARHALVPTPDGLQVTWTDMKARILSQALQGLNQTAIPISEDAMQILTTGKNTQGAWSKKTWAVVNATASHVVREAFGASNNIPTRVIEVSLFAGGKIGIVAVEGPHRNPSTIDLIAEFYGILKEQPKLASIVFDRDASVSRQATGQGCGSLTMSMSDARLSLFAAGMSEYLLSRQQKGLPEDGGKILIGQLTQDGLGLTWHTYRTPAVVVVQTDKGEAWSIHIHPRARLKIQQEMSRWHEVETGGVLMGRLSEAARVAHVVDVLEPPDDSRRATEEFVLGKTGLSKRLQEYSETVGWSLHCLGTWHSHVSEGGPSRKDRATAKEVAFARLTPSFFLIVTPAGFHAIMASG